MARTNYRVKVTDRNYYYTTYTTWVSARSKNQALVLAGALVAIKKALVEIERTGKSPRMEGLLEPDVWIDKCDLDEYWAHKEDVIIDWEAD